MSDFSTHPYRTRVLFEDIDAGGVVHHPKYLHFLERARCQYLEDGGLRFSEFMKTGYALVVAEIQSRYLKPLLPDQELTILTRIIEAKRSSLRMVQAIFPEPPVADPLSSYSTYPFAEKIPGMMFYAEIRLACVDLKRMAPCEFPERLKVALGIA